MKIANYRLQIASVKVICSLLFFGFILTVFLGSACAKDAHGNIVKEIYILLKPRIIALPGNGVSRVPLAAARVRSTELRELNATYNATYIERLYRLKKAIPKSGKFAIKGLKSSESSIKSTPARDLSGIFTKEIKKKQEKAGKEVIQVADMFLLQFTYEPGEYVNMNQLLEAYRMLDVVVYVDTVRRLKQ